MAITVVSVTVAEGGTPSTVVLKSDNMSELTSMQAKRLAIQAARYNDGGLANMPGAYPIDSEGECDESSFSKGTPAAAFQIDYVVNRKL